VRPRLVLSTQVDRAGLAWHCHPRRSACTSCSVLYTAKSIEMLSPLSTPCKRSIRNTSSSCCIIELRRRLAVDGACRPALVREPREQRRLRAHLPPQLQAARVGVVRYCNCRCIMLRVSPRSANGGGCTSSKNSATRTAYISTNAHGGPPARWRGEKAGWIRWSGTRPWRRANRPPREGNDSR
jgi:hypothetical protein